MIVVDASIMVGVFHEADQYHQQSRAWLRAHLRAGEGLIAPMLLLSEVAGAVTRRSEDEALGRRSLLRLMRLQQLRLVPLEQTAGGAAGRTPRRQGHRRARRRDSPAARSIATPRNRLGGSTKRP